MIVTNNNIKAKNVISKMGAKVDVEDVIAWKCQTKWANCIKLRRK